MAEGSSRQPRILVVDDEEHITELLAMGLGFNGFDVERAASGRAALDAVEQHRPDLIVLDVMLPHPHAPAGAAPAAGPPPPPPARPAAVSDRRRGPEPASL